MVFIHVFMGVVTAHSTIHYFVSALQPSILTFSVAFVVRWLDACLWSMWSFLFLRLISSMEYMGVLAGLYASYVQELSLWAEPVNSPCGSYRWALLTGPIGELSSCKLSVFEWGSFGLWVGDPNPFQDSSWWSLMYNTYISPIHSLFLFLTLFKIYKS